MPEQLRESVSFQLKEGSKPGRYNATIIEAGWGSSGYYSREMLARDIAKAFPVGTHMYINHPTQEEEFERPERDVRDLAAVLTSDPQVVGHEAIAEMEVFSHYQPWVKEVGPHIGLSIRAVGEAEAGEAEGREGNLIKSLTEGISVDFVTKAGAGGKVGTLLESARNATSIEPEVIDEVTVIVGEPFGIRKSGDRHCVFNTDTGATVPGGCHDNRSDALKHQRALMVNVPDANENSRRHSGGTTKEAEEMADEKRLSELEESVRQLETKAEAAETKAAEAEEKVKEAETRAERAEDALLATKAKSIVEAALTEDREGEDALPELPDRAHKRVVESALKGKLPVNDEGKLIESDLKERAVKAAREEAEYLSGGSTTGRVNGMGAGVQESNGGGAGNGNEEAELSEDDKQKLTESFQKAGLSEEAAKIAAEGR